MYLTSWLLIRLAKLPKSPVWARRTVMRGTVKVVARHALDGGTTVYFDGKVVEEGLNVIETFVLLGGILEKRGPRRVEIKMAKPESDGLYRFYARGKQFRFQSTAKSRETVRKVLARRRKRG